ncbi:MAG: branched-chain-amino-acid transaminase [Nitrospirae bacterium]|nr:branched-chain-amino-acid transaminase [Nitrospirota bacterium]
MKVYINGTFYPKDEAKVSVFDHGYLYGDGIYETLRAYSGQVFKPGEHMARLMHSARLVEMSLPMDGDGFLDAIDRTVRENGLSEAYIRVSVSRGPGEIGLDPALCPVPTVVIIAKEFNKYPESMYEDGIKVSVVKTRRNHPECLDPAIKSTNFLNNIFAKMEAKRAGAYEGIMLNHAGHVAEGTISNVFIVENGSLVTPPLIAGILDGVTRNLVIKLAEGMGMTVFEEPFTEARMWAADEAFITNTTMEVMPVTDVDGHVVGGGKAGDAARRLRAAYREEVARCLKTR